MLFLFPFVCLSIGFLLLSPPVASVKSHNGWVPVPGGWLPEECVHEVPSNTHVTRLPTGFEVRLPQADGNEFVTKRIPPCRSLLQRVSQPRETSGRHLLQFPPDYDGWTSYAAYNLPSTSTFDSFLGSFSVPNDPASFPDILYLFTGLQNVNWVPIVDPVNSTAEGFDIIQPVLQYPADTGAGWSVKSWFVTLDIGAIYSTEVLNNPGDTIFGNMTRVNSTGWFIGSLDVQSGFSTNLVVSYNRLTLQPWAYVTLEMYGATGCATYPTTPTQFTKLILTEGGNTVTPQWAVNPQPSKNHFCNEKTTVHNPQTITISFD